MLSHPPLTTRSFTNHIHPSPTNTHFNSLIISLPTNLYQSIYASIDANMGKLMLWICLNKKWEKCFVFSFEFWKKWKFETVFLLWKFRGFILSNSPRDKPSCQNVRCVKVFPCVLISRSRSIVLDSRSRTWSSLRFSGNRRECYDKLRQTTISISVTKRVWLLIRFC